MLPEGTTWLDLATLAIAAGGLITGVAGLALTFRRDRATQRRAVRLAITFDTSDYRTTWIVVSLSNAAMRTVTIERSGFAQWRLASRACNGASDD